MKDTSDSHGARRQLKKISDLRELCSCALGGAAALAILGLVRLLGGELEPFPTVIVPLLVIIGVVGRQLTQRRYAEALEDVELAARNDVRAGG